MSPKGVTGWQRKVWKVFRDYIRQRDYDYRGYGVCISCGVVGTNLDAGHYIHGKHYGTWINEKNVHLQCVKCNRASLNPRSENHARYAAALIRKFGPDIIQELADAKHHNSGKTWTITELKEKYEYYKNLCSAQS